MNKKFSQLKRKGIRCLVYEGKDGVKVERSQERILDIVNNNLFEYIIVKNLNPEQKVDFIEKIIKKVSKDSKKIDISGYDMVLEFIPKLTDINFDLDMKKDKEIIDNIINDPTQELKIVVKEINDICKEVIDEANSNLKEINNNPELLEKLKEGKNMNEVENKEDILLKELQENISDKEKRDVILEKLNSIRMEKEIK